MGTVATTSCSSDFLEEYSQDLARVQTVDDLQELVMGSCLLPTGYIYTANYNYIVYNENYLMLHLMSDELQENIATPSAPEGYRVVDTYFPFHTWQRSCNLDFKGQNSYESAETWYWDKAYELIANCNMVINEADELTDLNDDDRLKMEQVKGDAYFLRASYYFLLVNLYGQPYQPATAATTLGVPVKTSPNVEDKEYSRASLAEVYSQIDADLDAAYQHLSAAAGGTTIYHASPIAALLLHSRVKLYMQQWTEAADYAQQALALNSYLLDMRGWGSGYPISKDNKEVVFSNGGSVLGNVTFENPNRSSSYYCYSPAYVVDPHLISLYSRDDSRRKAYITNDDDPNFGQWSIHKIDNRREAWATPKTVSDVFALRTAEAYLNLAEARAQLGDETAARTALNTLRQARISGDAAVSASGAELLQTIREERERELCFEGHRWFDLRRYQVDEKYPFSKTIEHSYSEYVYRNYEDQRVATYYYRLEPGDAAYTLDIPKTVRDFQQSIGSNPRPDRAPYETVLADDSSSDDDDDDWDWDW